MHMHVGQLSEGGHASNSLAAVELGTGAGSALTCSTLTSDEDPPALAFVKIS